MIKHLVPVIALLALAGCAIQTEAQINAALARHVGESETDLVREMGGAGPALRQRGAPLPGLYQRSSGDRCAVRPRLRLCGFGGYGGFGGWGWGGYGPVTGTGPGWGFPSQIYSYSCETTFEVASGRVVGFMRHGNAC